MLSFSKEQHLLAYGRCLLLGVAAWPSAWGQGVTYPDGSVSPYPAGFFGLGIPPGAIGSNAFGVAAKGGTYLGAAGVGIFLNGGSFGTVPLFFTPGGGIDVLPTPTGTTGQGVATALSADGKIKVGNGGTNNAAYWDENNHIHLLPKGGGDESTGPALAISADGSIIAGSVNYSDGTGIAVREAVLWTPGGTGLTRLGTLPGFRDSLATGLSDTGAVVCGRASILDSTSEPAVYRTRGFVVDPVLGMYELPTRNGENTVAFGNSEDGLQTVGEAGDLPGFWEHGHRNEMPGTGTAFAVRRLGNNPLNGYGRIVGTRKIDQSLEYEAYLWDAGSDRSTSIGALATVLKVFYGHSIGRWQLTSANAMSQDGYTICGEGINPSGDTEGWVAVLPPIYLPPVITYGRQHTARLDEFVTLHPSISRGPVDRYSARGLPAGFSIDAKTGSITGAWTVPGPAPGQYSVTVQATSVTSGTGTTTFILSLPPASSILDLLRGSSFLPDAKALGHDVSQRSFIAGMTADGRVTVGQDGMATDGRAFVSSVAGGITPLPPLDGAPRRYGRATATSADGQIVVGQASSPFDEGGHSRSVAVVWKASSTFTTNYEVTSLGLFPGGSLSLATAVSADGSAVAGFADATEPLVPYQIFEAFRWTRSGGIERLGWLSNDDKYSVAHGISADGTVVVGSSSDTVGFADPTTQAFRWSQATGMMGLGRLPGGGRAIARAISADHATIVGDSLVNAIDTHAFRWTSDAGMIDLGTLPGDARSEAHALTPRGDLIVGTSYTTSSRRAFIWDAANGMRDLKSVLLAGNPFLSGWALRSANAISHDGKTISGDGINPNGDPEGFVVEFGVSLALTSISPPSGLPGSTVTLTGRRLSGVTAVHIDGHVADFTLNSDDRITVIVPTNATTGLVKVIYPNGAFTTQDAFTVLTDNDGDGMPDTFEQEYFNHPGSAIASGDTDGDGSSNLEEYHAGTDPTDPQSRLHLKEIRTEKRDVILRLEGVAHRRYRIEASATWRDGFPFVVGTLGPFATHATLEIRDSNGAVHPQRLYRAVLLP